MSVWVATQQEETADRLTLEIPLVPPSPRLSKPRLGHPAEEAGFVGIELLARQSEPWQVIDGIEFRSLTLRAWKPLSVQDDDATHEVIYRGPWAAVIDDSGTELLRGERTHLTDTQRAQLTLPPYQLQLEWLGEEPAQPADCCSPAPVQLDLLPAQSTSCCGGGKCD